MVCQNREEQPEFPLVVRKYLVQFMYLQDQSANADIFQLIHDDQFSMISASQVPDGAEVGV